MMQHDGWPTLGESWSLAIMLMGSQHPFAVSPSAGPCSPMGESPRWPRSHRISGRRDRSAHQSHDEPLVGTKVNGRVPRSADTRSETPRHGRLTSSNGVVCRPHEGGDCRKGGREPLPTSVGERESGFGGGLRPAALWDRDRTASARALARPCSRRIAPLLLLAFPRCLPHHWRHERKEVVQLA